MQKLVILLHADDTAHADWAIVNEAGDVSQVVMKGEVAALAEAALDRINIVIIPSEDVLVTTVTLPKMNRSRLLQAIPYALEEQVIEDVDTMHFAAGEYHANEALPVIVVSRTKMAEWMTLLQSFNIKADVMMPGIFALPTAENTWYAHVNDVAIVRTDLVSGFACDQKNLAEMLALAFEAAAHKPQAIEVLSSQHAPLSLSLPVKLTESNATAEAQFEIMARQAVKETPVNLLQGEFQNKKARGMPKMTSLVRTAAYLGIALLALLFLYPVVSFIILDQRAKDIKGQIAVIYERQFPNSKSIVAPKDRMQQKLNKLNSNLGEDHFLLTMANIGKALSQSSGVTLKRMDFQNNVVTLEISAASSDIFSSFTDAMMQLGLHVKQENANLNGAHVNATLEIE